MYIQYAKLNNDQEHIRIYNTHSQDIYKLKYPSNVHKNCLRNAEQIKKSNAARGWKEKCLKVIRIAVARGATMTRGQGGEGG